MTENLEILVVDDTEGCRDLYTLWLESDHGVRTAPNGTVALEEIDPSVDLVLLDRNMPGPSGLDVAAEICNDGYDCQIIMISSERANFSVAESPVDEYIRKPADRETLETTIEKIGTQKAYQSALLEFFAVSATVGRVEASASPEDLESVEEYLKLCEQAEHKHSQVNTILEGSEINWSAAFESLETTSGSDKSGLTSPTASIRQSP
ncbi:response regulator [Halovenus sp. HT40]|uniref:response regulator n=1 Tax=Halovenus sp. HT40 TaxID=3126691 RepID=UPI00300EE8BD